MNDGTVVINKPNKNYEFQPITDWYYFGPRASIRFDLRSGNTPTPDSVNWLDWEEAFDNEEFEHEIKRYVQHRFYSWIPTDVRMSRDEAITPQFIYRHFVLKFLGKRFTYQYTQMGEYYTSGLDHYWAYTDVGVGKYQYANDVHTTPVLYDELPIFEVI